MTLFAVAAVAAVMSLYTCGRPGPHGERGRTGPSGTATTGPQGPAGEGCTVTAVDDGALIKCGATETLVRHGQDGQDGESVAGPTGPVGPAGESCAVTQTDSGVVISCGESQVLMEKHPVVEVIDPCGPQGEQDEVLLRLSDGTLIAHYSTGNGKNRSEFLTVISPGQYRTTDNLCVFTVDQDGNVTW